MTKHFESPDLNDRSAKARTKEAKAEDQPELVVKPDAEESRTEELCTEALSAEESNAREQIHVRTDAGSKSNESGSCHDEPDEPQHPEFPDFGERYEVAERIGQGGMGSVYKVLDKETATTVAIKSLQVNLAKDATALKRFEMEADAASQLTHPNLISVLGRGTSKEGTPFIVMEYLEGRSLASVLEDEGALPPERAIILFMQITEGLAYVHEKGIVHRDIKPTNVILTKNGDVETARLVDFGIATILPSGTRETVDLTKTGDVFGSPQYMSPEQCLGFLHDQRSDVYSFGCLMYEVITGHPPFDGKTPVQLVVEHINSDAPPFSRALKTNKTIAKLEGIILRCLEKEQSLRFQSASELLVDLALVKDGKPVPKYVRSAGVKPILTKRQALGALAIVFVGLYYFPRLSIFSYDITHQLMSFVQFLVCFGGSWAFLSVGIERFKKLRGKTATARQWSFSIALCSIGLLGCSLLPYLIMNVLSTKYSGTSISTTYAFNGFASQEIEKYFWPSFIIFWSTIIGGSIAIVTALASIVGVLSITGKKVSAAAVWIRITLLAVGMSSIIFFGFPSVTSKIAFLLAFQGAKAYPDLSVKLLHLSSELDERNIEALMALVSVEASKKNYQGAADVLSEVLLRTENPKHPYRYLDRATYYRKLAQYDKAEADADKAISIDPKNKFSYNVRGEIRLKRNDYPGAISDFDYSIRLSPDGQNSAYLNKVAAYCAQKKWGPALSLLEHIVEINDISASAYLVRGIIYQHLEREDLAQYDFETALADLHREGALGPGYPDRNLLASFAFRKLGKNAESIRALKGTRDEATEWNSDLLERLKDMLCLEDAKIPVKL